MIRSWFLALPLAAALVLGACGGGDDDKKDDGDANATATADAGDNLGQPNDDAGMPAPTPVGDEELALTVVGGESSYTPTLAEFRALPTKEINAGGKKTGVALSTLAEQVGASGGTVTVQGLSNDLKRLAYTRHPFADIASETVLVVDEAGHLNLFSSKLPESEWVKVVVAISFQ